MRICEDKGRTTLQEGVLPNEVVQDWADRLAQRV
jgi:hypothetical protein